MLESSALLSAVAAHWTVWLVSLVLVVAAVIDGLQLRVPNWITFPLIVAGWIYSCVAYGWMGLLWSLGGTAVGLALLLPAYAIGGMGAGDVKLLAGVGAWMYASVTCYAFCVSAIVGGVLAIAMVVYQRQWRKHQAMFMNILTEMVVLQDAGALSTIAAQRKSTMTLLPYGIPIAIGTIAYFACMGLFF